MLKMLSWNLDKGGTGKTTETWNSAEYAAHPLGKNKRVLLMDIDNSENLSKRYSLYRTTEIRPENRVSSIFLGKEVVPFHLHDNLDIIFSDPKLAEVEGEIKDKHNSRLLLFSWIAQNYEELDKKYDYIFIDTRNDFSILTQNALAASDIVIGISDPSMDGFEKLLVLGENMKSLRKQLIDILSRESYVTAKYYVVANELRHNTNSSRAFKEAIEEQDNYIGYFQAKELFNFANLEGVPIIELAQDKKLYQKHKDFFRETFALYDKILKLLDEKED